MIKRIIIFLLCCSLVVLPSSDAFQGPNYTMIVPEEPDNIVVYYHPSSNLPQANGRISNTHYNY